MVALPHTSKVGGQNVCPGLVCVSCSGMVPSPCLVPVDPGIPATLVSIKWLQKISELNKNVTTFFQFSLFGTCIVMKVQHTVK